MLKGGTHVFLAGPQQSLIIFGVSIIDKNVFVVRQGYEPRRVRFLKIYARKTKR